MKVRECFLVLVGVAIGAMGVLAYQDYKNKVEEPMPIFEFNFEVVEKIPPPDEELI